MSELSNVFGRLVGGVSLLLTIAGFFLLLKQIKNSSRMRAGSHLLSMLFSLLMLLFNIFVMQSARIKLWFLLFLLFGAGFGFVWGTTTRMDLREDKVMGQRSVMYIYFWLASLIITQILGFVAKSSTLAFGLAGMFFSTGASLGTNANILYRIRLLFTAAQLEPANVDVRAEAAMGKKFCVECGSPLRPGIKFCTNCGKKVG